jgi:hypothetical protein
MVKALCLQGSEAYSTGKTKKVSVEEEVTAIVYVTRDSAVVISLYL